ncbi:cilia- and flagella-associated protein 418 [Genypterus blacodes]|uniref:cilia- and flagella-associated protein 418 n=1 Tax=Genypterus blacodes TaxID=154954 RepID=UPI003F75B691
MADLDELLDEVEKKFCVAAPPRADANKAAKKRSPSGVSEDIDALLEDLKEDRHSEAAGAQSGREKKKLQPQPAGTKCCPVFLGGSSVTNGLGTMLSKRSCDQLRCTSCDFRVLTFDDCEWDDSCDYLFFRNNMPEREKLRAKLKRRRGSRSYACQCSWFTAAEAADLRDHRRLRWVCGKHRD